MPALRSPDCSRQALDRTTEPQLRTRRRSPSGASSRGGAARGCSWVGSVELARQHPLEGAVAEAAHVDAAHAIGDAATLGGVEMSDAVPADEHQSGVGMDSRADVAPQLDGERLP